MLFRSRCFTEKLFTYALGRGVEHFDSHTIDEITRRLAEGGGRMSIALMGVIESPAFQRKRVPPAGTAVSAIAPREP